MITPDSILLPLIKRVEISGFLPLFPKPVKLTLLDGPFLILGGNGLGKTTTLQAIVFGLAGGADEKTDHEKHQRWGPEYFRNRLDPDTDPEILVEFALGQTSFEVRRGFHSDKLRGVKIGEKPWIHDSGKASADYESEVAKMGNYVSFEDFRYVVHRMIYLAEDRRSLLWDQWAQSRIVMLVCGEPLAEARFRTLSQLLTRTDSEARHRNVDIGHIQQRINALKDSESRNKHEPTGSLSTDSILEFTEKLQSELTEIISRKAKVFETISKLRIEIREKSGSLERLQQKLSNAEDAFLLEALKHTKHKDSGLALSKLVVYHRCPYCTQVNDALAKEAQRRVESGECPICGLADDHELDAQEFARLRVRLLEQTKSREAVEVSIIKEEAVLTALNRAEAELRNKLESTIDKLPRVPKDRKVEFATSNLGSLEITLSQYRAEHQRLLGRCRELKSELDELYTDFSEGCADNLIALQASAETYAKAFLGADCKFIPQIVPGKLHSFSYFVPSFADEKRGRPDSCSESERFFLDIAFRMALVELTGSNSKTSATFICETPENALDLAYTENVAEMFALFSAKSQSLLLTANIQIGGVAKPLLQRYKPEQRKRRVFNLIAESQLTEVQEKRRADFERELQAILQTP